MDECNSFHAPWSRGPWDRVYNAQDPGGMLEATQCKAELRCRQLRDDLVGLFGL